MADITLQQFLDKLQHAETMPGLMNLVEKFASQHRPDLVDTATLRGMWQFFQNIADRGAGQNSSTVL